MVDRVTYSIANAWDTGFIGGLTVLADANGLDGWTITFDAGFEITNLWGGEIVSHVGSRYTLRGLAWNTTLPADGKVDIGFQAAGGAPDHAISTLALNGVLQGAAPVPAPPTASIADVSVGESHAGTKYATFTVTLSAASTTPVTMAYATANGTALAGQDYVATAGTLTFAAGETSKTIRVFIHGDTVFEPNETFTLNLSNPSGATLARPQAIGTIRNDDVAPLTASIADVAIAEGNSGTREMVFTVSLSAAATSAVTMDYATTNGSALAGQDYVAAAGSLSFAAGEKTKTIRVTVNGDASFEANEALTLTLSNPAGATLVRAQATGTITNDDVAPPPVVASIADVSIAEGNSGIRSMVFTVSLSAASTTPVTLNYATADGTALAGEDYVATAGKLTFAAGQTSKTIRVTINGDTTFEATEALTLKLFNPVGATLARTEAMGTIRNDDVAPLTASIADVSVTEGSSGSKYATFTVSLSAAAKSAVTMAYATADGTALAGQDYVATSGNLTFAVGERSKTIRVLVNGDTAVEANESFAVKLSDVTGATLTKAQATGTITNDDVAPVPVTAGIADVTLAEGNAGTREMVFTVNLSAAAKTAITMDYATADGTALAGQDYLATAGKLTFAAGETSKTVRVTVNGDTSFEANESFALKLSGANGVSFSRAQATGTIQNDDAAPLPSIKVGNASTAEGNPGVPGTGATGFFSTEGSQIVDAAGQVVKIAGVNWFGMESSTLAPHGLWARGYKEMMDDMVELGFNTIRLPFSSEMLHTNAMPNGIDFSKSPDLAGLSALQVMDKIVDYADDIGLRIILDHHRNSAGNGTSGNGLWYEGSYTEANWIADWKMLATRYAGDSTIIGADLHNEPHAGTWGDNSATDWEAAAERAGNAVLASNPDWLIFVEGIANYKGSNYWWGGNLMGVRDDPVELNVANKLVYSVHDYPNSIFAQSWFQGSDFAAGLPAKFDQMWGYIFKEGIAPVYLGEFGSKLEDPKDIAWLEKLTDYLSGDFNADGKIDLAAGQEGPSWTWWSWNPNSGDTGGILGDDWTTVNTRKVDYLVPLQFDLDGSAGTPGDHNMLNFKVTLSAAATSVVTVDYTTVANSATVTDFTAKSGTLTFAPGEISKTISIAVTADLAVEANEKVLLRLSNPTGATLGNTDGSGSIVNDDVAAASAARMIASVTVEETHAAPVTGLAASLTVADSWADGFNATVKVHNDGAAVSGWQLEIELPNEITQIWNAEIVGRTEDGYLIRNAAWNGNLSDDADTSFGFMGSGTMQPASVDMVF